MNNTLKQIMLHFMTNENEIIGFNNCNFNIFYILLLIIKKIQFLSFFYKNHFSIKKISNSIYLNSNFISI